MPDVLTEVCSRTKNMDYPKSGNSLITFLLGLLNCFFFGLGVIIAGILENNLADVFIGIMQLCIPIVGWIWAVLWGVLMMLSVCRK